MKAARRIAIATAIAAFVVFVLGPYSTAAALIMRAAGTPGWAGAIAQWHAYRVSDSIEQIPIRYGHMRVRIFRPAGSARRSALLVSGVHRDGINEPRLVSLARELAATGVIVVTPEIEDLTNYRVTPLATDAIEDAGWWMVKRHELFGTAPIGLIGVSFSGGLSIVAAGRATLRDQVAYVVSFGGHGNLPRVLRYLCTGLEPTADGETPRTRQPHDYALAVVAHQAADHTVPAEQVGSLRQAIETFLQASALRRTSATEAGRLFEEARLQEARLSEPSRTIMASINERNVAALGRLLLPFIDRLGQDPSLSPDRSTPPTAPVYLLHGIDDNVIPAIETALLAEHLRPHTRVRMLLGRYLTHVDLAAEPTLKDTWDMIAFWKSVLAEH